MHQVPSPPYVGFRAALAKSSRRLNTSWSRNRIAALQRERDGNKGKKEGWISGVMNWCPTGIRISLPAAGRGGVKVLDFGLQKNSAQGEMGEIRFFGKISENFGRKAQTKI